MIFVVLISNDNTVTIFIRMEVSYMEKTATLNLRVNPTPKKDAESVLGRLEVSMSTAVDMFLNQVVLTGGIPFAVTLPIAPESIDTSKMSSDEIHDKIQNGYESYSG